MNRTIKNGMKVVLSLTEMSYLFPPLLATLVTALLFYKMKSKE